MRRPVRIVHEPFEPSEDRLRYSLDVYDERDNHVELIGKLADLQVARAAFRAAVAERPGQRIFLRERGRVLARFDELEKFT